MIQLSTDDEAGHAVITDGFHEEHRKNLLRLRLDRSWCRNIRTLARWTG